MPAGIVTGLHAELALVRKHSAQRPHTPLMACHGPGQTAALAAAGGLIAQGATGLLSFGFAGAIDERIKPGTLLLPEIVRTTDHRDLICDPSWRFRLAKLVIGDFTLEDAPLASVDAIVEDAAAKMKLRYATGAIAVDMESAAVGDAAQSAGLPFAVVRAVADPALQSLPILAVNATGGDGRLKPWRIAWSLIRHPGQIGELRRLAANASAAADSLAGVCKLAGPGFGL